MSLYWIIYKDEGNTSVLISESSSLLHASMKAGIAGAAGIFTEGHMLDPRTKKKVPKNMRGVVLSHQHAVDLLEELG